MDPDIYFLDVWGQGRNAVASTGVHEFSIIARGHHGYKTKWTSLTYEIVQVVKEDTHKHDEYFVTIIKGGYIVGYIYIYINTYIPKERATTCSSSSPSHHFNVFMKFNYFGAWNLKS